MTDSQEIDGTVNKAAFWSAVALIVAGVLSVFFPLDAPEGPFADRMQSYSSNVGAYVMGSVVQMIAMLEFPAFCGQPTHFARVAASNASGLTPPRC